MDVHDYLGVIGSAMIISIYALLQAGRLRSGAPLYLWGNLIGSGLIPVSLSRDWNLGAAIIEIFFICISLYGLAFNHDR